MPAFLRFQLLQFHVDVFHSYCIIYVRFRYSIIIDILHSEILGVIALIWSN